MGLYYILPTVYCHEESVLGMLLFYLVTAVSQLWTIIGGISVIRGKLYLVALVFWGYNEEILIQFFLAQHFNQNRPRCSTVYCAQIEDTRRFAMPSLETQLIFSLSAFLILYSVCKRHVFPPKIVFSILVLPLAVALALVVSHNNTLGQVLAGALIGLVGGIRKFILFNYFIQHHIAYLSSLYGLRWFLIQDTPPPDPDPNNIDNALLL